MNNILKNKFHRFPCLLVILSAFVFTSFVKDNKHVTEQNSVAYNAVSAEKHPKIIQVAIVGAGIAGLAAAQITAKRNLHTIVFQGDKPGGQLSNTSHVYNWLGVLECQGKDIISAVKKQAKKNGTILDRAGVASVDFNSWPFLLTLTTGEKVHALSVIITTGADQRKLQVPGEVEYINKGVVTHVFEKDPKWKGLTIVVVGSGDDAVRKAESFTATAKQVYLLVRGKELKVAPPVIKKLETKYKNLKIVYETSIKSIYGNGNTVQGVEIQTGKDTKKLSCDVVAVAIGIGPNSQIFRSYLACDKDGYILLEGRSQRTSCKGVLAAGDVTEDPSRKAVVAGAEGIKAGYDAAKFLKDVKYDVLPNELKANLYQTEAAVQKALKKKKK
jgi:thioredoxin reductase (NADPH)